MDDVIGIARAAAEATTVGDPNGNAELGPVVSETQWNKIQGLIQKGIDEGATLVAGGTGRPEGLDDRLLRKAHRLRQRHQRHDHRPRGNLRPRRSPSSATTRWTKRSPPPTTPPTAWPPTSRARTPPSSATSPASSAPAR